MTPTELYTGSAIAGLLLLAYLFQRLLVPKRLPSIPHASPVPLFGDIPKMARYTARTGLHQEWFIEQSRHLGNIFQVYIGPWIRILIVSDPNAIAAVLRNSTEFERSGFTTGLFTPVVIPFSQIALPTNAMWKAHRKILGPSMNVGYLRNMTGRIGSNADVLVQYWEKKREVLIKAGRSPLFALGADFSLATMVRGSSHRLLACH